MTLGHDRMGIEILDADECNALLRRGTVGRLGFVVDGEIDILPVTYGMDRWTISFRTGSGEKLAAAIMERVVAFEVDSWDADAKSGWSVLVKGTATMVTDAETIERLEALGLELWVPENESQQWVQIRAVEITGRRVAPDGG